MLDKMHCNCLCQTRGFVVSDVTAGAIFDPGSTSLFDVMFTSGRRIFKSVCSSAIRL